MARLRPARAPLNGEAQGNGPDGHVCTWNLISGCTEEGVNSLNMGPVRASGQTDLIIQFLDDKWLMSRTQGCPMTIIWKNQTG